MIIENLTYIILGTTYNINNCKDIKNMLDENVDYKDIIFKTLFYIYIKCIPISFKDKIEDFKYDENFDMIHNKFYNNLTSKNSQKIYIKNVKDLTVIISNHNIEDVIFE